MMKINTSKISKDISDTYATKEDGQKVEVLFSIRDGEVVFSGHAWACNCSYSISDLIRNNDFMVRESPEGELAVFGAETDLTQDELTTLYNLSILI